MRTLSATSINAHSPYAVIPMSNNTFVFYTKFGVKLTIGFVEDYTFSEENVYQFFILSEETSSKVGKDVDVMATITAVVEEFFKDTSAVLVYVCDYKDGREAARNRKFQSWFNLYEHKSSYTFLPEQIVVDSAFYASMIIHNNHPHYQNVVNCYADFVDGLRNK